MTRDCSLNSPENTILQPVFYFGFDMPGVLAISTRGNRLCPHNYYWHPQIFIPSDGPGPGHPKLRLWFFSVCLENCTAKSFFVGQGCDNFLLIGNGICNGENNNKRCLYDGGDCCGYDCPNCQCFHEKICAIGG